MSDEVISSRQNPVVRAFRDLAKTPSPDGTRLLLDGVHLVREAAAAGVIFEAVAVAASRDDGRSDEGLAAQQLRDAHVDVVAVGDKAFEALSPVRAPSGIAAIVRRAPVTAADICGTPEAFVIAAIDIQDPGNLGALIRSAEAGGATGVIVCGNSANPFSWKSVRGSMGSLLRLPVATAATAKAVTDVMRTAGGRIVATAPRGGTPPDAVDWRGSVMLLLGGEGPGLDEAFLTSADDRTTIPMADPVESLNVAVAAAVLVYAARRQRT